MRGIPSALSWDEGRTDAADGLGLDEDREILPDVESASLSRD